MRTMKVWSIVFAALYFSLGIVAVAGAQGTPAATYQESCGGCHFAYQPFLLPSGSWEKMLSRLPGHFGGQDVDLDPGTVKVIQAYLKANAAEHSSTKVARKIMDRLGRSLPERITDVPYLQHKHRKLDPAVFKRQSVGSLANCIACHKTADQGNFNEHNVSIPR